MMAGYAPRWYDNNEGAAWKKILDSIAKVASKLEASETHGGWGAAVTREHWDAPKFDLRWYTHDGIGRAVQVLIEGRPEHYHLRVSGSAWKDFDQLRERWWKAQEIISISVPPDPDQLDLGKVEKALWSARRVISKWKEGDLSERVQLPVRDASPSDTIVRGRYIAQATGLPLTLKDDVLTVEENALAQDPLGFYPELITYWAEHGAAIQRENPGKYLVLVALLGPAPEYYTDQEAALARAKELGARAFFIPIPAKRGGNGPTILE